MLGPTGPKRVGRVRPVKSTFSEISVVHIDSLRRAQFSDPRQAAFQSLVPPMGTRHPPGIAWETQSPYKKWPPDLEAKNIFRNGAWASHFITYTSFIPVHTHGDDDSSRARHQCKVPGSVGNCPFRSRPILPCACRRRAIPGSYHHRED
jgi:hypothetical protein